MTSEQFKPLFESMRVHCGLPVDAGRAKQYFDRLSVCDLNTFKKVSEQVIYDRKPMVSQFPSVGDIETMIREQWNIRDKSQKAEAYKTMVTTEVTNTMPDSQLNALKHNKGFQKGAKLDYIRKMLEKCAPRVAAMANKAQG